MPVSSRSLRCVLAGCAAAGLAACGGGHAASVVPAAHAGGQQSAAGRSIAVQFRIVLPQSGSSTAVRRSPRYVSAATKSATVTVTPAGGSASAPTAIACSAGSCTGQVPSPVGSDTFGVNLFDQPAGAGNLLSTGMLTQTIVANTANIVNVTFNGVVHSLALSLSPTAVTFGTTSTVQVLVAALDADGNTIVGPGSYVDANGNPVTIVLTDSDTSGATHLSVPALTAPPATPVTLSYNGASISCITVGAAATTFTPASTVLPATGPTTLYVAGANAGTNEILALLTPSSGATVSRTISGASTGLTAGIYGAAVDACDNLMVTSGNTSAADQVLVFSNTSNGNVAPVRSFGDPNNSGPGPITFDAANDPTVAFSNPSVPSSDAIEVFPPTASGAVAPTRTIAAFGGALGLSYDLAGNVWDVDDSGVYVLARSATQTPGIPTIIGNGFDEISRPTATVVDPAGNLYVANSSTVLTTFGGPPIFDESAWVLQFAPGANGYPVPVRSIVPPGFPTFSGNTSIGGIGTDATGRLYVLASESGPGTVLEYAAPPSTSSAPVAQFVPVSGTAATLAVTPDGTLYLGDTAGNVYIFAPSNTTTTQTATLTTTPPAGSVPVSLNVANDGTIFVGDATPANPTSTYTFQVYAPGSTGNAAPIRSITGPTGTFATVSAAVDPSDNFYFVSSDLTGASTVVIFPAGSSTSNRSFTVPALGAAGASYDPMTGNLALGVDGAESQTISPIPPEVQGFPASSTGSAAPAIQIRSGAADGTPYDAAPAGHDAAGNIYIESEGDGSVRVYNPATLTIVRSILGLPVVGPMSVDTDGTVYIAGTGGTSDANLDAKRRASSRSTARNVTSRVRLPAATRRPRDNTTADFGAILVYGPTASGLVAPTTVIPAGTLGGLLPTALAISHG